MTRSNGEICELGISELSGLYRSKKLSPVETVRSCLDRIRRTQPDYNLFITVTEESALLLAGEAEKRMMKNSLISELDGVPFAVKDLIYTKDVPTTMGCEIYKDSLPQYNATVVDKMADAGAVLMGKLNTHQFAFGPTGDRSLAGSAKNPHNPKKVCGGSSSGSAGAVAAQLVPVTLGTDTGGSIRIPSSCCGVTGIKPTYGRASIYGILPVSEELDHVGPITKTAGDNALILNYIAGYDPKDHFSADIPCCNYTGRLTEPIKGTVIGVPYSFFSDDIQPWVLSAVKAAILAMEKLGATIKEISFPDLSSFREAHQTVLLAGAYTVHEQDILNHPELIAPDVLERMEKGNYPATDFIRALYMRPSFKKLFRDLMSGVDIMMMPTLPITPTDLEARDVTIGGRTTAIYEPYTRYTWISNFSGFPALSMPCGFESGLPMGIQLIGHEWDEDNVYRFAANLEKALS